MEIPRIVYLIHRTQQLRLQYEFAFLVLLRRLERLVVLPPHRLLALPAHDVPHNVPTRRHVAFVGVRLRNVDDGVEEVGFAMLAAEVLRHISTISILFSSCRDVYVEESGFGGRDHLCSVAWHSVEWIRGSGGEAGVYMVVGKKPRTREIMESWLARWVLQLLQPKILSEFRYVL